MQSPPGPDLVFEVSVDPDSGSYVASARGYGIVTKGGTLEELRINILNAVDCYFDENMQQPERVRMLFAGDGLLME